MKLKTYKAASKRVLVTGSGKLRRRRLSAQHLTAGKSKRTLQKSGRKENFSPADTRRIKKLVPHR